MAEQVERRLAAILAADVVGYSRLMGADEGGTLAALKAHRAELIDVQIAEHRGRIVKLTGDGILVEFPSVVNAVACAAEIQRRMRDRNADVPVDRRIELRIGVNLGDVIVESGDIFGDGVNIAARLEGIADAGGVAISGSARDHVGNRLGLAFADLGERALKNIDRPVRVYAISLDGQPGASARGAAPARRPADTAKPSIAVLPFANLSGDPEQEYFSDGITEDIITDLSKISGLFVVARNTAFAYKGRPRKVQEIAAEARVRFFLEGSVRKAGPRVRVTGQLVDGADGGQLWAERYDRDLTDIFAVQDEITRAIVDQLKIKLLPEEKQAIAAVRPDNIEAYTYDLKGRQLLKMWSKTYMQMARTMFARAAQLDPTYARAFAAIAECDSLLLVFHGVEVSHEEILATSARALALDGTLAEAHAARGLALSVAGRRAEAVAEFQRAIALDPELYEAEFLYGGYLFAEGEFEGAARALERATTLQPDEYRAPMLLRSVYRSLGRRADEERIGRLALARAECALALHPENSSPAEMGAGVLAALGERDRALEWAALALALNPDDDSVRYNIACVHALLGDHDRAIDLLEKLLPASSPHRKQLFKNDPDLDPLRTHPRYGKLLAMASNAAWGG